MAWENYWLFFQINCKYFSWLFKVVFTFSTLFCPFAFPPSFTYVSYEILIHKSLICRNYLIWPTQSCESHTKSDRTGTKKPRRVYTFRYNVFEGWRVCTDAQNSQSVCESTEEAGTCWVPAYFTEITELDDRERWGRGAERQLGGREQAKSSSRRGLRSAVKAMGLGNNTVSRFAAWNKSCTVVDRENKWRMARLRNYRFRS